MQPAQWLMIVAAAAWVMGLARAIRRALGDIAPASFPQRLPLRPLGPVIALIAHYADRRLRASWRVERQSQLLRAGLEGGPTPPEWFALRCLAAAAALGAGIAVGLQDGGAAWFTAPLASLLGWLAPELWLRQRVNRRLRQIRAEWPLHLELLLAGLEAGLELPAALQLAARSAPPGPIPAAMTRTLSDMPRGSPGAEVLRRLRRRLQEPASRAALEAIVRAERDGFGLRRALRAAVARQSALRLARAERCLERMPGRMVQPLLTCCLPSVLLLLAAPVALTLLAAY